MLVDPPQLQQGSHPVPAAARAFRGLIHLSHREDPSVALPRSGSCRSGIPAPQSIAARLPTRPSPPVRGRHNHLATARAGGPALLGGSANPAGEERSTKTPSMFPGQVIT